MGCYEKLGVFPDSIKKVAFLMCATGKVLACYELRSEVAPAIAAAENSNAKSGLN